MRHIMIIAACAVLAACSMHEPTTAWYAKASAGKPLTPAVEYVAHAPEFVQRSNAAYDAASAYIIARAPHLKRGSWAVVMDLDQTVMNNIGYHMAMDRAGEPFTPETWRAWTSEKQATLMPGALKFIRTVNAWGGHVAFVSNRRDYEQLATEENLAALGLQRGRDFRVLITRAAPFGDSDKNARFALVPQVLRAQGYPNVRTIAYLGDVTGDAPRRLNGARFFCIPQGGMYGENC